ncbi:FtsK/SpoIIIE domain-containing protein [Carbonactinospora thermoautotrophica]|uniref:FtsK/SpoIIIE domain-containing protein n=1 Tax=Carbonactinospora thermoautotrophica TaxID=1469144 RepID=UPI000B0FB1E1|nr:FtsK/SpoIIIE domain-containing protein [Carbonactinospora thermoautotrophica]
MSSRWFRAARVLNGEFSLSVLLLLAWLWVVWKLVKLAFRLVRWAFRHPAQAVLVLLAAVVLVRWGVWALVVAAALAVGLPALAWFLLARDAFCRRVGSAFLGVVRRWLVYAPRWDRLMSRHGLVTWGDGETERPKLRRVHCTGTVDRLLVAIPEGMAPAHFEEAADALAHATKAQDCRVRVHRPGEVRVELLRRDPLRQVVPPLPVPDVADLDRVPVGLREDGELWRLRLLGTHVLVAGATGAGKGSVLWSLVRGVAPAVRDGLVELWVIDPKGGMELAFGQPMFARFADGDPAGFADLLDEAVAGMDERTQRLKGHTRQHEPTPGDPFRVLVIDELASLTALVGERKIAARIDDALGHLLTKGRTAGYSVVGALQDPAKDVIPYRNLFPTRVALRLDEPTQVDMVLGDGARDRGAYCDRIPESLPGVGFVKLDGVREPFRVRASYLADDEIRAMAAEYARRPALGEAEATTPDAA